MSRYDVAVFGVDYYGEGLTRDFDSSPFRAVCTGYGKAQVTWRRPGGAWSEQRLVRSTVGFPVTVDDGTVLFAQTDSYSTDYFDSGLASGREYYYALFVYQDEFSRWRLVGQDEVL